MAQKELGDFTAQAEAYCHARPGYPEALLDQLIAHVGVKAGDPVADIGAGTGLFTQMLAALGFIISAIEPNEAMRARAPRLSNTVWLNGTFEATSLPPGSQQWVTSAQAFHWAILLKLCQRCGEFCGQAVVSPFFGTTGKMNAARFCNGPKRPSSVALGIFTKLIGINGTGKKCSSRPAILKRLYYIKRNMW